MSAVMHVERTDDPRVLRWVCHEPRLIRTELPPTSPLGKLLKSGAVTSYEVVHGDLLVVAGEWDRALTSTVNDAIAAELDDPASPLLSGAATAPSVEATIDSVQMVIDGVAGSVADAHGGRIEVVAVDIQSGVVTVALHGACHGCSGADNTLTELAQRAVRSRFPDLHTVQAAGDRSVTFRRRR